MRAILVLMFLFALVTTVKAQVSSVTGQYLQDNNILLNPGFESGIGKWVNSAGTFTADYTNFVQGKASGKVVLSAQALAFTQDSTSFVTALADGVQGLVSVYIKSEFAAKVCSRSAGVTVTTNCVDVVGNNKWSLYKVPSILGATSNGISINTNGTSVTGTIYIDESFVGITDLAASVDASTIAGEAYFAGTTGCNWTRTSTTIGAFGTVAACPAPTIVRQNLGAWQTTDADLPRITVNNLPAGTYKAKFLVRHVLSTSGNSAFAINDGTTTCEPQYGQTGGLAQYTGLVVECTFNYTSAGNRVFELYAGSTANAITISSDTAASPRISTKFILEYFGSSSVYTAPANQNNVELFSAKISSAGIVSAENVDWINGNASIASTSRYTINFSSGLFNVAPNCVATVTDALSTTRLIQVNSISTSSATLEIQNSAFANTAAPFSVICQKQGADFTASRLIVGQFKEVVKSTGLNGAVVNSCEWTSAGAFNNATMCNAGFTAISKPATGRYQLTFRNTQKNNPVCVSNNLQVGGDRMCNIFSVSTTAVTMQCENSSVGTDLDVPGFVICHGVE